MKKSPQKCSKIIDNSETPKIDNLSLFFRRKKDITKDINVYAWIWLCIVEIIFGVELLESLIVTSSANRTQKQTDHGWEATLNNHIPRGLIIDQFRKSLVSVLYYKYYYQYCMLIHVNPGSIQKNENTTDLSTAKFAIRKGILYQLIYFRRVYYLIFLIFNVFFNTFIYFYSDNFFAAITLFIAIHTTKGIKA